MISSIKFPLMDKEGSSPFIDQAAVEAWDAWFRWRRGSRICDVSIEATWSRIARALAEFEPRDGMLWERRFFDALSSWRIVPDEQILAKAGIDEPNWRRSDHGMILNAAAFVSAPFTAQAHLDVDAFQNSAELAVRALDAVVVKGNGYRSCIRVGMMGVADALALLGVSYDSRQALTYAVCLAKALAEGTFRANVQLGRDRGSLAELETPIAMSQLRAMPSELVAQAQSSGLRYDAITEVRSHSKLALLANNVADAVDPLSGLQSLHTIEGATITREVRAPGFVAALANRYGAEPSTLNLQTMSVHEHIFAQIELRGAIQPWIDRRIDYPIQANFTPNPQQIAYWDRIAAAHQIDELRWQKT